MNINEKLANRTRMMDPSAIRELFKVLGKEGMISLAGGAPASNLLPFDALQSLHKETLERFGNKLLQYGITEGLPELRRALIPLLRKRKIEASYNEIAISTGAQTAIDAAIKVLINEGSPIVCEAPCFLASINCFNIYAAKIISCPLESDGVSIEKLEESIVKSSARCIYLIPNFQNPSGITLSLEKRKRIVSLAKQYECIIIEDDPYFELRYEGEHLPSLKSMLPEQVIYVGSLSKIFAPGMRVGFYIAPKEIQQFMTTARQACDVHTNNYAQALACSYLESGALEKNLDNALRSYKKKRDVMLSALDSCFSSEFFYVRPDGGMFVWVVGPDKFDAKNLQQKALKHNVAFVPGAPFFADAAMGRNSFRLNFTNVKIEDIPRAIETIWECVE